MVVTPWDALAGTKVDVRTARGNVSLGIPPGSRTGRRLRLRGQGFPAANGASGHGDCIARIEMDLPPDLSQRQEELLRELGQAARGASPAPEGRRP